MDNKLSSIVSYALATIVGACFIGGLVILSGEGENPDGENRGAIDYGRILVEHK
jgi:hypothetical protein